MPVQCRLERSGHARSRGSCDRAGRRTQPRTTPRPPRRLADPAVSLRDLAVARTELPLPADLLGVCPHRAGDARAAARRLVGGMPPGAVPSRGATPATIRSRVPLRTGIDPCLRGICLAGPQKGDRGRHARATQSDPGDRPFGHDHHRVSVFLRAAAHQGSAAAAGAAHRADGRDAAAAGGARRRKARGARRPRLARGGAHAGARDHARASRSPMATVEGSLALTGGRIDNLVLSKYRETTAPDSPNVRLLNPPGRAERVLRRVRLGARGSGYRGARPRHRMAGRRREDPSRRAGHAELGQRRGSALHAHRRGRRALHVHDHPAGREHGRRRRSRSTPMA